MGQRTRSIEASPEHVDVELGGTRGMQRVDPPKEITIGDRFGAFDEQVRAMPDKELLVSIKLSLERTQVAAVHRAAELCKVRQLVLG